MDVEQALNLVIDVVSRSRALDPALLSPSTRFVEDLGFDSLDASELLAALHSRTGHRLDISDLSSLQTVGQVARTLVVEEVRQ
jgi:acyl carrier protein